MIYNLQGNWICLKINIFFINITSQAGKYAILFVKISNFKLNISLLETI